MIPSLNTIVTLPFFFFCIVTSIQGDFPVAQMVKNLPARQKTWIWSLGWKVPLEKGMAIHSSILAWRIPWTEKPGRLQSAGLQRVGHDWVTNTHTHLSKRSPNEWRGKESACNARDASLIPGLGRSPGRGHSNPLKYSFLENPQGQRSLAAYSLWCCRVRYNWATKHTLS